MSVLIHNARILTLAGGAIPRRGDEANELSPIERGYVLIGDIDIQDVGAGDPPPEHNEGDPSERGGRHTVIDAGGRVVMPAFADAHTHACWAGDRLDEWDRKRAGASYLDILNAGGGIMSTVRAVREASLEQLAGNLAHNLARMSRCGTAAAEVKSGYGLDTPNELKMLRAVNLVREHSVLEIHTTAMLGHAIDPDQDGFIDRIVDETLPAVSEEFPGVVIDAYCEEGAWSLPDCRRLFLRASELGHPLRVHADQFNPLGMTPLAVEMGARSVDHLEASTQEDLRTLAESDVFGVMLPACGFHLDDRYADGRLFMDMGGALVIASNNNPGSAPCPSMPFIVSLAVRKLGLTIAEAISACTVNAHALLGDDSSHGVIATGSPADLILLNHTDERMLAFEFGGDAVDCVIAQGRILKRIGCEQP